MTAPAFDQRTTAYSLAHAFWLGKAAILAYKDSPEIEAETAQWGFDRFRLFHTRHQFPFPLEDTQAYAVASDHMIIVAFRGTEPNEIRDWLSDANTPVVPGPANKGLVHLGFNQALTSIYPALKDTIAEFRSNKQTLWFTGHSLGGALAMLASARMYFEDPRLLPHGVCTFGQPRTCDRLLASAYDSAFKSRTFRSVNNNDIVTQAPPEPVFHHIDTMMYFDTNGELHEESTFMSSLTDRFKGFTSDMFAPGTDGIRDHSMGKYLANLEKNLA